MIFKIIIFLAALTVAGYSISADSTDKMLYLICGSHLDTQWRWTIKDTIKNSLPATLKGNFDLFEKYPDYTLSFEGAFRYGLMKEYYPEDYKTLKSYIVQNRWAISGSAVDLTDVNISSPESNIRNFLYGKDFFRKEFGKTSSDAMLIDNFGFGYAYPTVAAHCGIKGFTTLKLPWGCCVPVPFDIGIWEGVDGSPLVSAFYRGIVETRLDFDLSADKAFIAKVENQGRTSGLYKGFAYFGAGDAGGALDTMKVNRAMKSIHGKGPLKVINKGSEQLFLDITPAEKEKLPRYNGELLLTAHGTGCYTSHAELKRLNRQNELLADSAEKISVIADWLGGNPYPGDILRDSWIRFLWHQFHDDLTGTSIPEAYTFTANDEYISLNRFADTINNAAGTIARTLDTRAEGIPLMVYNPLPFDREDVVETTVNTFDKDYPFIRIFDNNGNETPSQIIEKDNDVIKMIFLAKVPSVGFSVYDARPSDSPCTIDTGLKITDSALENEYYRVLTDKNGDVCEITDKVNGKQLLSAPSRFQILQDKPRDWSAWEISYQDVSREPNNFVSHIKSAKIIETGPVRISIEIVREEGFSSYNQIISLKAGESGKYLEFKNTVDWRTTGKMLKVAFPLTVSNPEAVYDLGIGVISRGNNRESLYEVPAQQWAEITDKSGSYGITVMNDCKYGWDKPSDSVLRLTLIHTPVPGITPDQGTQDIGRHRFSYAVCGHKGNWSNAGVKSMAAGFNQPMIAFTTGKHNGQTGKEFSFVSAETPQVWIMALKKTENSAEIVIRVSESTGKPCKSASIKFFNDIISAREINGAEEPSGTATFSNNRLTFDLSPFQPKTFAVKIKPSDEEIIPAKNYALSLPYNMDAVSFNNNKYDGSFDISGDTIPGELLPDIIECGGISFKTGPKDNGMSNAVKCGGQKISLPENKINRIYILGASLEGERESTFILDEKPINIKFHCISGFFGQTFRREKWDTKFTGETSILPGYVKSGNIGWISTHTHNCKNGDLPYEYSLLYKYSIPVEGDCKTLTLPNDDKIIIFAITTSLDLNTETLTSGTLYEKFNESSVTLESPLSEKFEGKTTVKLKASPENAEIRFTLDGSDPDYQSPLYSGPFNIDKSVTLKAKAFSKSVDSPYMLHCNLKKAEYIPSVRSVKNLSGGLKYSYYEGEWIYLPDFDAMKPSKTGVIKSFTAPPVTRENNYALKFEGYIDAPKDGIYVFSTVSNDGCNVYIDGVKVVENDFWREMDQEAEGTVALKKGLHRITVTYFQKTEPFIVYATFKESHTLKVYWQTDGIKKSEVKPSSLFH